MFLRTALPLVSVVLALAMGLTSEAAAHHGFTGVYDFCRPIYLEGTVTSARHGYPHAEFVIDVPGNLALPRDQADLRAIEEAEQRNTLSRLVLPRTAGRITILLEPVMTRTVTERQRPRVGDRVRAIAYERVSDDRYRGELRILLLSTGDGESVLSSRPRTYHRGCRE